MNGKWRITMLAAVCALAVTLSASVAKADPSDDADAHVWLDVVANMSVDVKEVLQFQDVQTGIFPGTVTFRIDANTQRVNLQVIATNLYKGDDPDSNYKIFLGPAAPDGMGGALVEPSNANATDGHSNLLLWNPAPAAPVILFGMEGKESEAWDFESGELVFSQDVDVTVDYEQPDDELPMGEYSGWIKLIGICVP